jgi:hypothetical protein
MQGGHVLATEQIRTIPKRKKRSGTMPGSAGCGMPEKTLPEQAPVRN